MLRIYTVEEARQNLLKREALNAMRYPPSLLERTARLFGPGVTPNLAVAQVLASVRAEGDAALRRWSKLLDRVELDDFRIPPQALQAAGLHSRLLLQVHDELVLECPQSQLEQTARIVCQVMETAYPLKAPLQSEARFGTNWGTMTTLEAS